MLKLLNPAMLKWLGLALLVIVADHLTKFWISSTLDYQEAVPVLPFFSLVRVHNTGAAFSFLADAGGWQRWFFAGIAVVIAIAIVVALRRQHREPLVAAALALVLGGALGNLWDRLTLGRVVDFVLAHWNEHAFPAFNVADSAITIGVAALLWESVRPKGRPIARAAHREET